MRTDNGRGQGHAHGALTDLIRSSRVIVCCGSGGVGKTTTGAALAMRAAMEGLSAVVITIDPAKRLATSLGLKALSPTTSDLTATVNRELEAQGREPLSGRFHAVMPDTTQTFENFVRSMAGADEGLAKRVLRTSIYKIFAREFSGANEYMAMEKLHEVYNERRYDLVVLDTPPSANTRTFLEAPRMLAGFFDDRVMKWFIAPGSKLLAGGIKKMLELLERLTGHGFMSELLEFTAALFDLRAQFMENLRTVGRLLHEKEVAFLMVTSPERLSKSDTQEFVRLLEERGYRFWGFVVNRVLGRRLGVTESLADANLGSLVEGWARELRGASVDSEADTLKTLTANFNLLLPALEHEQEAARFLSRLSRGRAGHVALVAEQPSDVHSVGALLTLSQQL